MLSDRVRAANVFAEESAEAAVERFAEQVNTPPQYIDPEQRLIRHLLRV